MIRLLFITLFFLVSASAHAWTLVGKIPPSTHTVQLGTFQIFKSDGGAVRYLAVKETKESICGTPEAIEPSSTFKNPVEGLYKEYKSPTGTVSRWLVSFADECGAPISDDTNTPPPPQDIDFTGLVAVSINPTFASPNDCTYAEFQVTKKNADNTYQLNFKRLYDAATVTNGVRTCQYR